MITKTAVLNAAIATLELGDRSSREIALQLIEVHKEALLAPEPDSGDIAHDACCIWEWILERRREPDSANPQLALLFANHGSCAIRFALHSLVPQLEKAWFALGDERFNRVFDWEFVPEWCEENLVRALREVL